MFEINKDHCVTIEQKLLYNIYMSLTDQPKEVLESQDTCEYCGGAFHENIGVRLACAKKHKRRDGG